MSNQGIYRPGQIRGTRYLQYLEEFSFNVMQNQLGLTSKTELEHRIERVLKLHALFGGKILLSSNHIVGSGTLMGLFDNSDFRFYLSKRPDFLCFVTNFHFGSAESREDIVKSGLVRSTQAGWKSSAMATEPVVEFAEIVLANDSVYPGSLLASNGKVGKLIQKWRSVGVVTGEDEKTLRGSVYAIDHFLSNIDAPVARSEEFSTVYECLKDAIETRRWFADDYERIKSTIETIEDNFDTPESVSFSEIIRFAESAPNFTQDRKDTILQTSCHAYNVSLVRSLDPTFGAYVPFRHGAPLGLYLDTFRDMLIPENDLTPSERSGMRGLPYKIGFGWDLNKVSWRDIADLWVERGVQSSAERFQQLLSTPDPQIGELIDGVRNHIDSIAPHLMPARSVLSSPWVWFIGAAIGLVVGGILDGATN